MPPPSPSTEYLALGGSLGTSSPCPPRRSTVKRTPQYRRAPPSACRQPLPPSSQKRRRRDEDAPGSFGAAARPLPEPRVLPFGGGKSKRPVSPSGVPLLDGEHVDTNDRGSQGKNKKKAMKVKLALRVPGKGGASRLVSLGKGVSSAFLSAVTRSRGGKPVPSEARLPPSPARPGHEGTVDAPHAPVDTDAHVAALDGETFSHHGPNFFAPIGNTGVTGVTQSVQACSPDDDTAAGAHCTVLGWSCLLALAGSLSLLMGDGARIVVTYCSDDEDESDEEDEEECQSEGDLCSVPDVDGAHSLDEFIYEDYFGGEGDCFAPREVEIGSGTSTADMLALGALGMLLGGRAPRAVTGGGRQCGEDRKQVVWGGDEESSLPSIDGGDESSLPSIDGADEESSLPSVYEAEEASLPSLDGEDDEFGDLPAFDASSELEEVGPRTSASEVAGLSLLGMLLGSPAPRCLSSANDRGSTGVKVVWEDDDGASLPSIDGADGESSLPCIEEGDDASIPSMGGEGDVLGDLPAFDASPTEEEAGPTTSASEVAGLSLLGMLLGSPAPRCLSSANDRGNTEAKAVWEEDDCASLPSIDGADGESSLPCIEEGDDASIPSLDGESDDVVADLPSSDSSLTEEGAGPTTSATEVAGLSLLGMLLGSPAPSCVPAGPGRRKSTPKANLWDDCGEAEDLDGVLPDCQEEAAPAPEEPRLNAAVFSLVPSLSGTSDDDSAEDDSLPPSMDGTGPTKAAASPLSSSPDDVMAWGTLVAILSSPAPSPVKGRRASGGRSLWEDCDVPLPPEL